MSKSFLLVVLFPIMMQAQGFFNPVRKPETTHLSLSIAPNHTYAIRPLINVASSTIPDQIGLTGFGVSYQSLNFDNITQKWISNWTAAVMIWYSTLNKMFYGIVGGAFNNLILIGICTDGKNIFINTGIGLSLNN